MIREEACGDVSNRMRWADDAIWSCDVLFMLSVTVCCQNVDAIKPVTYFEVNVARVTTRIADVIGVQQEQVQASVRLLPEGVDLNIFGSF